MDLYRAYQRSGRACNDSLTFSATTDDTTIITARSATMSIYIQRIIVWIKTDAAQSLTFQDSAGTPVIAAKVSSSPGVDTRWDFDFGPKGYPLTAGKDLIANFSAVGLAGHMEWNAYQKKVQLT